MGVCVLSCNLLPVLWAEWLGSFACYCGNKEVERIQWNKCHHTKLTLKKENLLLLLSEIKSTTFWSWVWCSTTKLHPCPSSPVISTYYSILLVLMKIVELSHCWGGVTATSVIRLPRKRHKMSCRLLYTTKNITANIRIVDSIFMTTPSHRHLAKPHYDPNE